MENRLRKRCACSASTAQSGETTGLATGQCVYRFKCDDLTLRVALLRSETGWTEGCYLLLPQWSGNRGEVDRPVAQRDSLQRLPGTGNLYPTAGVFLTRASLYSANLASADLRDADLTHTDLRDTAWDETTNWEGVKGLETARNVPAALKRQSGLE